MKRIFAVWLAATLAVTCANPGQAASKDEDGWSALFDGKTLDGWQRHGGQGEYRVEFD